MTPTKEIDLTPEEALQKAHNVLSAGPLAMLDIRLGDPDQVGLRIAEGLAAANTLEELLSDGDATGWEKHAGRSVLIRAADYMPSTKPGGIGIYVVATCVDAETGEQLVLTSGATNVVIQVAKILKLGKTDVPVALTIKPTSTGNEVHRLVKGEVGETAPF